MPVLLKSRGHHSDGWQYLLDRIVSDRMIQCQWHLSIQGWVARRRRVLHCTGYRSTALNMNTTAQHVGGGKSSMVHRVGDDWPWADMLIMMRISGSGSGGGEITKKRKRMPVWWMDEIPLCVGGSPVRTMDVTIQWRSWKGRRWRL